jgi:tetratricopeptide (TPR) repeat protein
MMRATALDRGTSEMATLDRPSNHIDLALATACGPALLPHYRTLSDQILPAARDRGLGLGLSITTCDLSGISADDVARRSRALAAWRADTGEHRPCLVVLLETPVVSSEAGAVARRRPAGPVHAGWERAQEEMIEMILADPLLAPCTLFYEVAPVAAGPAAAVSDDWLQRIERIRAYGFAIRDRMAGTAEVGRSVADDLAAYMERIVSRGPAPGMLDLERRAQEAFSNTRRRIYIPIASAQERLEQLASSDSGPLIVSGEPGSGKSTLLANWIARYRAAHPESFAVLHHVGISAAGGDHRGLLRRIMAEIRDRYGIDDPIPATSGEIERAFPYWLTFVQQEPLLLLIDALDQLDPSSFPLTWLPDYLSPRIRLVVSAADGDALEELRARGWEEHRLAPLTLPQRREMIRLHMEETGRQLSSTQMLHLADDSSANPLILRTRLEEMAADGSDGVNERIGEYLEARDLDDLYQRVLARIEERHGATLVRETMSLLWSARHGLTAAELRDLLGAISPGLDPLLSALRHHLRQADGLITFLHNHLRATIERRYLAGDAALKTALHRRLARYFGSRPVDARRAAEEPWQLRHAGEWDELRASLAAIPMFTTMYSASDSYELMSYWLAIDDRYDAGCEYVRSLERHESGLGAGSSASLLGSLGTFLFDFGKFEYAERFHRRALAIREQEHAPLPLAETLDALAQVLYRTGKRDEARSHARRALVLRSEALGETHRETILCMANLAALLHATGDDTEAESLLRRALVFAERLGEEALPAIALVVNNLGALHVAVERFDAAAACFERAFEINARRFGPEHPEVASNLVNLAFAHKSLGRIAEAERHYGRAIEITERALGREHPDLALALTNLGVLHRLMDDLDRANALLGRALLIRRKALGDRHIDTLHALIRLGRVAEALGDLPAARDFYAEAVEGMQLLLPADHPDLVRFTLDLARLSMPEPVAEGAEAAT